MVSSQLEGDGVVICAEGESPTLQNACRGHCMEGSHVANQTGTDGMVGLDREVAAQKESLLTKMMARPFLSSCE